MPPPLRRSGSGLLQTPEPGLLPSPKSAGLGPLGASRVVLSTRQSSPKLRPAASLLLASAPDSHLTLEVDFRAPLVACPGGTHTRRSFGPSLGTPLFELFSWCLHLKYSGFSIMFRWSMARAAKWLHHRSGHPARDPIDCESEQHGSQ